MNAYRRLVTVEAVKPAAAGFLSTRDGSGFVTENCQLGCIDGMVVVLAMMRYAIVSQVMLVARLLGGDAFVELDDFGRRWNPHRQVRITLGRVLCVPGHARWW